MSIYIYNPFTIFTPSTPLTDDWSTSPPMFFVKGLTMGYPFIRQAGYDYENPCFGAGCLDVPGRKLGSKVGISIGYKILTIHPNFLRRPSTLW